MKNQINSLESKLVIRKKVIKNYATTKEIKEQSVTVSVSSTFF
ncbi:hypothetical protein [Chryseobacterium sp. G0186]|nr:hypothetical protein [Chryseobacterium sp. G0186]